MESVTDREWKKWGASDPYYGVLGHSTESVADPERRRAYLETGKFDLGRTLADVEALFGPVGRGAALDFGCGVGRIMFAMLDHFDHIVGVDISPGMIAEARKNVAAPERTEFFNLVSQIEPGRRFDFVHSFIVLQHIRPKQGIPLIRSLLERVKPGGHFALHLTIEDYRRGARLINMFRYRFKPLHLLYNISRRRRLSEPVMEISRYPFWKVLQGIADLTGPVYGLRYIDHDGPIGVTLMGRIPAEGGGGPPAA